MRNGSVRLTDLITVREASKRTGIHRRTIYKWIANERVWSIRVSDVIMLHKDDVDTWITDKAS